MADEVPHLLRLRGRRDVPAVLPAGRLRPQRGQDDLDDPRRQRRVHGRDDDLEPLGGVLSDRFGKRRPFVAIAGLVMVVGLAVLAFAPNIGTLVLAEAIIGFGAGSFLSVDLALATQVLPNPDDTAKDLGVLNIANALPQSIAPAIAPAILAVGNAIGLGGYTFWYLVGAVVALAGAVLVYRIKGVK
ncbi:MFS transporter [Luteimicrobium album]|nr:MFS transporter [Luteimicrobium album]